MTVPVLPEGSEAPEFELPAWSDGDRRRVALSEFLGEDVVVLAFYPADFNPACSEESGLDELDLFTMQRDVSVLGIGPDTVYSHAAFADAYDLQIPLLSDTRRQVAERYGVAFEDDVGQDLIERAVVVVDHDGEVTYTWSTRDLTELPSVDEVKEAIGETGGDDTAFARYRVGHAHYVEGRRAFTAAMTSYRDSEWMIAQSDFKRGRTEFEEAADHFDSAARFVDDPDAAEYYDLVQEKATALWQAADWLGKSANAYSSGAGAEAQDLRDDADGPLETARDIGEPVDPDDWPPDFDGADGNDAIYPQSDSEGATLSADIDEEVAAGERDGGADEGESSGIESTERSDDVIDDEELEALQAELAANRPDDAETRPDEPGDDGRALDEADDADEADDGNEAGDGDETGDDDPQAGSDRSESDSRAEFVRGASGVESGGSGSVEPARETGDGAGLDSGDEGPSDVGQPGDSGPNGDSARNEDGDAADDDLAEPQGASDADLDDIPTAEDLADDRESMAGETDADDETGADGDATERGETNGNGDAA